MNRMVAGKIQFAVRFNPSFKMYGDKGSWPVYQSQTKSSEFDLGSICIEFQKCQDSSLEDWIRNETSGDYQRLLLALIGAE
uniref:Uncharacterized protein n=1 Tax=Schistosoma mansoni TaxID=6183 RepID=A0A5K4F454_SCHMA